MTNDKAVPTHMSDRARAYMLTLVFRHGLFGVLAILIPSYYLGRNTGREWGFPFFNGILALDTWGVIFLILAVISGLASATRNIHLARAGLAASFFITIMFASLLAISFATHYRASPLLAIAMFVFVMTDLIMLSNPIRVPFEDRQLTGDQTKKEWMGDE